MHIEAGRHSVFHHCGIEAMTAVLAREPESIPLDRSHVLAALYIRAASAGRSRVEQGPPFQDSERRAAESFLSAASRLHLETLQEVIAQIVRESTPDSSLSFPCEVPSQMSPHARDRLLAISYLIEKLDSATASKSIPCFIRVLESGTRTLHSHCGEAELLATARAASGVVLSVRDYDPENVELRGAMKLVGDLLCGESERVSSSVAIALAENDVHSPKTVTVVLKELLSRQGLRSKETLGENPYAMVIARKWSSALTECPLWKALPERALLVTLSHAVFGSRRVWGRDKC